MRSNCAELPGLPLRLSIGLMNREDAGELKSAGAGWINHNLNTSRRFYPEICTTHTYDDRIETIENVRAAGLSTCSGGIIGMGETDDDILDLAYSTRQLAIDSVPLNFLHPIKGTPLEAQRALTPEKCLKAACLFRLLNPRSEVRAAGGRELNVGARQATCSTRSIRSSYTVTRRPQDGTGRERANLFERGRVRAGAGIIEQLGVPAATSQH